MSYIQLSIYNRYWESISVSVYYVEHTPEVENFLSGLKCTNMRLGHTCTTITTSAIMSEHDVSIVMTALGLMEHMFESIRIVKIDKIDMKVLKEIVHSMCHSNTDWHDDLTDEKWILP